MARKKEKEIQQDERGKVNRVKGNIEEDEYRRRENNIEEEKII